MQLTCDTENEQDRENNREAGTIKISVSVKYLYLVYIYNGKTDLNKFQIVCLMSAFCFLQAFKQHDSNLKQRREKASTNSHNTKRCSRGSF